MGITEAAGRTQHCNCLPTPSSPLLPFLQKEMKHPKHSILLLTSFPLVHPSFWLKAPSKKSPRLYSSPELSISNRHCLFGTVSPLLSPRNDHSHPVRPLKLTSWRQNPVLPRLQQSAGTIASTFHQVLDIHASSKPLGVTLTSSQLVLQSKWRWYTCHFETSRGFVCC